MGNFHNNAYKSARIYKDNTKRWHDKGILIKVFEVGQQVLLFNLRFQLFLKRLRSR